MRLRHTVLGGGIVRRTIFRPEPALASYATLQLRTYLLGAALLEWIGAASSEHCQRKDKDEALHLRILRSGCRNASARAALNS